jgi:2-hydroxychromene-2-carboxylate isomerase
MPKCEFIFDFGSPNAYLSHFVVKQIEARCGVRFDYGLVLLGGLFKLTNNQPPMLAFGEIPNKMSYMQLETERFIEKHGITKFKFNPNFPINTLQLMRCAIAAEKAGVLEKYIEVSLQAMWEQGLKMDDSAVILETFNANGLDGESLIAASKTDAVKQALLANTEKAAKRGAFGVPTFFIDDAMFFGKDTLRDIEELINSKK